MPVADARHIANSLDSPQPLGEHLVDFATSGDGAMFVTVRRVSRAEKLFRIMMVVLLLPMAAATMHWAVPEKRTTPRKGRP